VAQISQATARAGAPRLPEGSRHGGEPLAARLDQQAYGALARLAHDECGALPANEAGSRTSRMGLEARAASMSRVP
jgi:hypothetical protein